ncbi:amino acid ABC transporter substrate-binding protein [Legionella gratiana]|uniref:Amino acid ABC transporter substrate-binding protein n=1 Tax=Legionella gratiana TaxID=45066 RepID=A0A378JF28_9GAMM|nr:transporter substrate-binding domain-containing protein [Legionella gratiana]KTD11894.1 amino acid ABC transporter substrate-binding protein [Legionella gratiana]STX46514.1 amino acid ABC transporter substrate-binding protein [Legionella gratiana]
MKKSFILIICIIILPFNLYGRTLKIGISHFDPPFVIQLSHEYFSGFDINMAQYICKKLDYEYTFVSMDWNELIDAVAKNDVDIAVSGFTIPQQGYSSQVTYSLPYLITKIHIIGLDDHTKKPLNFELLHNTNIGITDKDYLEQFKKLNLINTKFVLFDQDDDLINALRAGKIKFALIDSYSASYWDINSSDTIKDFGPIHAIEYFTVIAINSKDSALQKEINEALIDYLNSQEFMTNYKENLVHFQK